MSATPEALRMGAVYAQIDRWDEEYDDDNYSQGQAADDLRAALTLTCICAVLPHTRRCPCHFHNRHAAPVPVAVDGAPEGGE
jgi:hypothetical protein